MECAEGLERHTPFNLKSGDCPPLQIQAFPVHRGRRLLIGPAPCDAGVFRHDVLFSRLATRCAMVKRRSADRSPLDGIIERASLFHPACQPPLMISKADHGR
jgi:hypothetical protein